MSKPVVFVSDLGLRDEFVGVCHAVIARVAPASLVIDISHGVAPHDIRAGASILAECLRFAPADAVGLGVVDPGVGTARIPIAIETAAGRYLVGPDNGLLSLAWRADGGPLRAVTIASPEVTLSPISSVFHGRDVFAPAAGHLAAGMDLDALGPSVAVDTLVEVRIARPGGRARSDRRRGARHRSLRQHPPQRPTRAHGGCRHRRCGHAPDRHHWRGRNRL